MYADTRESGPDKIDIALYTRFMSPDYEVAEIGAIHLRNLNQPCQVAYGQFIRACQEVFAGQEYIGRKLFFLSMLEKMESGPPYVSVELLQARDSMDRRLGGGGGLVTTLAELVTVAIAEGRIREISCDCTIDYSKTAYTLNEPNRPFPENLFAPGQKCDHLRLLDQ